METIDKIVHERIWVTEYEDTCPVPVPSPPIEDLNDPFTDQIFNYGFLIYKQKEWVFKRRYLDVDKELKDFGNPLCRVEISRYTLCLEEDDNKVALKLFITNKTRKPGVVWFSRKSDVYFITFNKKTENVYHGYISGYNKRKKSRKIHCNHFFNSLNQIYGQVIPLTTTVENPEYPQAEVLDVKKVNEIFGKFYSKMGITPRENYFDISTDLYFKYLTNKGVKFPDNFLAFKQCGNKPPQRLFKKNGMKLVETYMQHYGIRGDKFRKILHQSNKIDFYDLTHLVSIFTIDFLLERPETELRTFVDNKNNVYPGTISKSASPFYNELTKKEKLNFYYTFLSHYEHGSGFHSFNDHIRFYQEITKHEKVRWKSNNISSFRKEHIEFTDKYDFYTHGHYDREFDETFVNYVQQPFFVYGIRYTPVLFQKNNQYIEESSHQSNCVKTYNGNIVSVIISLRNENNERLTMQFIPKKTESGRVIWKNAQTRARFNENPTEDWKDAIEVMENKLSSSGNFTLPKMWFINYNSRTPVDLMWGINGKITSLTSINTETYGLIEF
jgi:hypothetical protein